MGLLLPMLTRAGENTQDARCGGGCKCSVEKADGLVDDAGVCVLLLLVRALCVPLVPSCLVCGRGRSSFVVPSAYCPALSCCCWLCSC